jgi:hypothetical protein
MNANELFHKLEEAGADWADKQAAFNVLDDTKNAVLAQLMLKSNAPSVAAREIEAKASGEYIAHVKATQDAMKAALKAKVHYESMKTWIELKRTEAANDRAAMRLA